MLPNGTRGSQVVLVLAVLLAVPALSGCIGQQDTPDDATTPQGDAIDPSAALQDAWDQGFRDPYLDTEPTGEVKEFDIWVNNFTFTGSPDESRSVPGPEIRVTQGDTVRVNLHSDDHTIHWHGYDVPWPMDGVPFLTQGIHTSDAEDPVYTYEFVAKQAGTYWYHCTVGFPSHKDAGMFGAFIVEPKDPDQDLPYDREETLMLHEADSDYFGMPGDDDPTSRNPVDTLDATKSQVRTQLDFAGIRAEDATGIETWSEGPRPYYPAPSLRYKPDYDTFMINGRSYPDTDPVEIAEGEVLRVRLINAGQLFHTIHLHGHHFLVTHKDSYKLDDPYWADTIGLVPGGRKDVYIHGTNPGIWNFHDHGGGSGTGSYVANDYAFPGGMKTVLAYEDFEPPGELPQPEGGDVTAGDLAVHAPSYHQR